MLVNFNSFLNEVYIRLLSLVYIPNWIIDKNSKTILDIGCGTGLPMRLINFRRHLNSTGIDLFKPYIDQCKRAGIHDRCIISDANKLSFKPKSFDIVFTSQVIEHLVKKDAEKFIEKAERLARRQVIISTPVGRTIYGTDDGNILQRHRSYFYPEYFQKRGYKIIRIGGKGLFGEGGLAHRVKIPFLRKLLIALDILLTPFYLMFQNKADYYFWAYKSLG